jgi:aryl-alcohol dehydrogenase
MQITAAVTEATGAPFVIQPLDLGDLAPDEILVEVSAAGICHTDLIVRDQWSATKVPAP